MEVYSWEIIHVYIIVIIYIHVCNHIYIYVCIYICVCIYSHIYIYIHMHGLFFSVALFNYGNIKTLGVGIWRRLNQTVIPISMSN